MLTADITPDPNGLIPNPSAVDSWPTLVAFIVQCVFVIGVPALLAWNRRDVKHAKTQVEKVATTAESINTTLTERNGGSSVLDVLNEIRGVTYSTREDLNKVIIDVSELKAGNDKVTENNETITVAANPLTTAQPTD